MTSRESFDLGIEGGVLVTPKLQLRANLYVKQGRIAAITKERLYCHKRVDAGKLLLMPGMIDAHVHLMDPGDSSREDFPSGSSAAACAGVTTLIEHTHSTPIRTAEDLVAKRSYLDGRSHVDFGLGAHAWDEDQDLEALWKAGVCFFKAFSCTTHGVPGWNYGALSNLFRSIARLDAICLVHCEDESLTREAKVRLLSSGRTDGGIVPEWRNRSAELVALAGAVQLADRAGARVVLAHVSSSEAVELVRTMRRSDSKTTVESCPQYMEVLEEEVKEEGALRKFTPPARARSRHDLREMWSALECGRIDYIGSDHAPSTRAHKCGTGIWDAHFGLPGLDTTMPILLNGAATDLLSYERLVEVYSEAPAKTYGLYPKKGALQVGSDADLILVDPMQRWVLRDADIRSKAGWSPYSGRTLVGRAVRTYVRGNLVCDEGRLRDEGLSVGQFLNPMQRRKA